MKKILSLVAIIALIAVIFTFAACGNKTKNEMTSLKDDATSMMDDMSSALSGIGDDMTAEGNVTDDKSSTGLFEDMTSDKTTEPASQTTTAQSTNSVN